MDINERLFVLRQQYQGLSAGAYESSSEQSTQHVRSKESAKPLSFQSIVDAARFPELKSSQAILKLVNSDLARRKTYTAVLSRLARFYSPALSAASSVAQVFERQAKGFALRVSEAPSQSDQVFVMLKFDQDTALAASYTANLHIAVGTMCYCVQFSEPYMTTMQAILSKTSAEYSAIVNPDARLYLLD